MRIGVLSDTHGDFLRTLRAAELFAQWHVEEVLHCGDVGAPELVWLLEAWPAHFVAGNVDDAAELERRVRAAGRTWHGRFGSLEFDGRKIAFLHGDDERLLRKTIQDGRWHLVCHGHTHVAAQRREGDVLVLNPGALHRTSQPSIAVVELPSLTVTPVLVDA
jgi:putative phosphoesterase